ncbi:MAG: polysaccharide deacetylase family protein [Bacteroidales bacterium]|nr:polysaccharide deacetylase family protein [Bacteroidales bacterium]
MKHIALMYHDVYVDDTKESGFETPGAVHYKISKDVFLSHVKAISDFCYEKNISKEFVDFTFDDGGVSFYTVIAPVLEEYGWYGKFFISTKYIGTKGFLSEDQIRELRKRGHIIGSHSHQHRVLTEMPIEEVSNEIKKSISILSNVLNERIDIISIPNGSYSSKILKLLKGNGLKKIYTSNPSTKISRIGDADLIGRYAISYNTTSDFVLNILSSPFLRFRFECKYRVLGFVKLIMGSYYSKIKTIIRKYLVK